MNEGAEGRGGRTLPIASLRRVRLAFFSSFGRYAMRGTAFGDRLGCGAALCDRDRDRDQDVRAPYIALSKNMTTPAVMKKPPASAR